MKSWFSKIRPCKAVFAQDKRLAWFRLHGVPLHLWSAHFFKWFAKEMGVFVDIDCATISKTNMEVARILVLMDHLENFDKIFAVEEGSFGYYIFVCEEIGGTL